MNPKSSLVLAKVYLIGLVLISASEAFAQGQSQKLEEFNKGPVLISRDQDTGKVKGKPTRPGEPLLGDDVSKAVKQFQENREAYLEQQKELALQVKADSQEARETLRAQNRMVLDQLKEQQRLWRQEAKERARDLKKELHPDLGRVIDAGTGEGRDRI